MSQAMHIHIIRRIYQDIMLGGQSQKLQSMFQNQGGMGTMVTMGKSHMAKRTMAKRTMVTMATMVLHNAVGVYRVSSVM